MRRLKRLRNTKERRMIADDTNNNKNKVARKVNLYDRGNPKRSERKRIHRRTSVGGGGGEGTGGVSTR
jgi:hypothetical protein